jgi:Type I phosphodiesterase / nucleotide pyrophosphatase
MHSFAALPGTIERLLTGSTAGSTMPLDGFDDRYDRILLVYLDAFGWKFVERHAEHPLLVRARDEGSLLKFRSQFPSTTTAHATTLQSGLPVGVHGLYEWFILEPSLDRLIAPLLFSYAGDSEAHTLVAEGFSPSALFPAETLHMRLGAAGVRCVGAVPRGLAHTVPNEALTRGAEIVGFDDPPGGFAGVAAALAQSERVYASVYLPSFDALMHVLGPDHPDADSELVTLLGQTADGFAQIPEGTLFLVVSDHGMSPVSPERTTYVNVAWPELERHLRRGADGKPLAPGGSCRDLFLHILPGHVDEVVGVLAERLAGVADVLPTQRLVEDGTFGEELSDAFLARLAEVVVLPHHGEAAYWLEPHRFEQRFLGQHGGLSPDEMEIPLLALVR